MRAKDKRKADTFKVRSHSSAPSSVACVQRAQSVLADIQNSTHDKKVPQPDRVLKKAIGLRLDGEAKCREGATALADQYRSEIDVLAAFLTEDERTALTQASEKAKELATSETALPDLLKELRTAYSKHIDGDLLAAIGKAALASSRS